MNLYIEKYNTEMLYMFIICLMVLVIAAYDNARLEAKSVAVLDGKLIEYLHVHEASAVIKRFHELEKLKRK